MSSFAMHDDIPVSTAALGAIDAADLPSIALTGVSTIDAETGTSFVYAGFGRRLGAFLIDSVIIYSVALLIGWGLFKGLTADVVTWLIVSCYFWTGNSYGATPAKKLLSIRVIDAKGAAPGLWRGFVRALLPNWLNGLYLVFGTALPPVFVIAVLQLYDPLRYFRDQDRQTLHDEMAATWVVRM